MKLFAIWKRIVKYTKIYKVSNLQLWIVGVVVMLLLKKFSKDESKVEESRIYFSDLKVQKSFEKFSEAAKNAPLEDQMRLIKKAIRD